MKRLLPSVIIALTVHLLVLSTDFSWLKLAPGAMPALKSLTITLPIDTRPKRKARAAIPNQAAEKQLDPALDRKPIKNPAGMPTPARVEETSQPRKPLPAMFPENRMAKARPKKNLKALTRKKQTPKTDEAARPASIAKRHVPPEARAKIFDSSSSAQKPTPLLVPADNSTIKKTHRVPDGALESTTTATVQPATQIENTLPGAVLKIARPLYKQNTSPPYPPKARRMGYEGIVILKVLINKNGGVNSLTVLESSGYDILDQAALSAVKKWLFEPGTEGGIKKKMWVKIPIRFQLE